MLYEAEQLLHNHSAVGETIKELKSMVEKGSFTAKQHNLGHLLFPIPAFS